MACEVQVDARGGLKHEITHLKANIVRLRANFESASGVSPEATATHLLH